MTSAVAGGRPGLKPLMLIPVMVAVAALTWLAERLDHVPSGLPPYWLACGVAVGAWRWSSSWPAVPWMALALAMVAGAMLGGVIDRDLLALAAVAVTQCAAVAWGSRSDLPRLLADRRPVYRVRLGHLGRFIFVTTAPASLLAGLLVAGVKGLAGLPWAAALESGAVYAAASGLSVAILGPVTWWDQLRAVPWRGAMAAALVASAVPLLMGIDARFVWAAPAVAIAAGYFGSVWAAAIAAAGLSGGFLVLTEWGQLPFFEGPEGFVVMLLVVWRLLATALLAALWSERRAALQRSSSSGRAVATPSRASMRWREIARPQQRWLVMTIDGIVAPDDPGIALPGRLPAGHSLRCRVSLYRMAAAVRGSDLVVGLGRGSALLLLLTSDAPPPRPGEVAERCRKVTQAPVRARWSGQLSSAAVGFLLASAAYLDDQATDADRVEPAVALAEPA